MVVDNEDTIGKRLKMARIAAGYNKAKDFCQEFKICPATFSLHETNRRALKLKVAKKYAEWLKVDVAWLMLGRKTYDNPEGDAPVSVDTKNSKGLSNQALLQNFSESAPVSLNIYPPLYSHIVIEIHNMLRLLNRHMGIDEISQKAVEMYQSIVLSTNQRSVQFSTVKVAVNLLKQQILKK